MRISHEQIMKKKSKLLIRKAEMGKWNLNKELLRKVNKDAR